MIDYIQNELIEVSNNNFKNQIVKAHFAFIHPDGRIFCLNENGLTDCIGWNNSRRIIKDDRLSHLKSVQESSIGIGSTSTKGRINELLRINDIITLFSSKYNKHSLQKIALEELYLLINTKE